VLGSGSNAGSRLAIGPALRTRSPAGDRARASGAPPPAPGIPRRIALTVRSQGSSPGGQGSSQELAPDLLRLAAVNRDDLIEVREIRTGGRRVVIQLYRNAGGSVAARFLLGEADMPIIDADSVEEALATAADALEGALLARAASGR